MSALYLAVAAVPQFQAGIAAGVGCNLLCRVSTLENPMGNSVTAVVGGLTQAEPFPCRLQDMGTL